MRFPGTLALGGALLAAGCQNLPEIPVPPPPPPTPVVRKYQPLGDSVGRVQSVNERLKFVVLDFSLNRMPADGDRFELVRDDEAVGELKVTGPVRNTSTVADIVRGNPRPGDLVRPLVPASPNP
jgi:hypothetical protein